MKEEMKQRTSRTPGPQTFSGDQLKTHINYCGIDSHNTSVLVLRTIGIGPHNEKVDTNLFEGLGWTRVEVGYREGGGEEGSSTSQVGKEGRTERAQRSHFIF